MSLKQLVNNSEIYTAFQAHLDELIKSNTNTLINATDLVMVHRSQGAIQILNKLKKLRESVNEHS